MAHFRLLLATLAAASLAGTGGTAQSSPNTLSYTLFHDYVPKTFFHNFTFYSGQDPTHGTVNYLSSRKEAVNKQLIGQSTADDGTTTVKIAVDAETKLQGQAGRNSIRITSKNNYNKGLFIFDVIHMPPSVCGLWPALWLLGDPESEWPKYGEVDIIEGVNQQQSNLMTLHTKDDCKIGKSVSVTSSDPDAITYTGKRTTDNCNAYDGTGCQIAAPQVSSASDSTAQAVGYNSGATYGSPLNEQGGAIFAVEWISSGFKVWSWPRKLAPFSVKSATANNPSDISPGSDFGTPVAHFGGDNCNWNDDFKDLAIVINIDFCGDWAGKYDWNGGTCTKKTGYKSCSTYVRDHPEAFAQAYWEFGAFRYFAPASSNDYNGTGLASGSPSDGYEYIPINEGDALNTSAPSNDAFTSDVQNTSAPSNYTFTTDAQITTALDDGDFSTDVPDSMTTPMLVSTPTTLVSTRRLITTLVSPTFWSYAPSSTDYGSLSEYTKQVASEEGLLNCTWRYSRPAPSPSYHPVFNFSGPSPAESIHALSAINNASTTQSICVYTITSGVQVNEPTRGCAISTLALPISRTFPHPSYLFPSYQNSTSSTSTYEATAIGFNATRSIGATLTRTPISPMLSSTATPTSPNNTPLLVPVDSSAPKSNLVAEASLTSLGALAALVVITVVMVVFM